MLLSKSLRNCSRNVSSQHIYRYFNTSVSDLKVAIVTGSSSGIGLGIAKQFAINDGMNVVINGRRDETKDIAASIQKELPLDTNQRILYHQADMSSYKDIKDLVSFTMDNFGQIDILVNNAGMQHVSSVIDFPIDKWQQLIDVNLSSTFYMIKETLPFMIDNANGGRIINMASQLGLFAQPFKSGYVAAKHGVVGLTKSVALEVAKQNITCNAICPGYVDTDLVRNQLKSLSESKGTSIQQVLDEILVNQPTGRLIEIEEISALASFLCSDNAKSINGTAISIDGGALAK